MGGSPNLSSGGMSEVMGRRAILMFDLCIYKFALKRWTPEILNVKSNPLFSAYDFAGKELLEKRKGMIVSMKQLRLEINKTAGKTGALMSLMTPARCIK